MPRYAQIMLAAALTVECLLMIAAALPIIAYRQVDGGRNSYKTYATIDGVDYRYNDFTEEQQAQAAHIFNVDNVWCLKGRRHCIFGIEPFLFV